MKAVSQSSLPHDAFSPQYKTNGVCQQVINNFNYRINNSYGAKILGIWNRTSRRVIVTAIAQFIYISLCMSFGRYVWVGCFPVINLLVFTSSLPIMLPMNAEFTYQAWCYVKQLLPVDFTNLHVIIILVLISFVDHVCD